MPLLPQPNCQRAPKRRPRQREHRSLPDRQESRSPATHAIRGTRLLSNCPAEPFRRARRNSQYIGPPLDCQRANGFLAGDAPSLSPKPPLLERISLHSHPNYIGLRHHGKPQQRTLIPCLAAVRPSKSRPPDGGICRGKEEHLKQAGSASIRRKRYAKRAVIMASTSSQRAGSLAGRAALRRPLRLAPRRLGKEGRSPDARPNVTPCPGANTRVKYRGNGLHRQPAHALTTP
jgi:hypothetical protein